ncbi:MAG TPA: type IV pilin [Thermoplasmatales archaeon]|nr:type IV pilin [Thermoplasmatales archaeon]
MIEKIRKMLKDKAGVSPIIAIILMVAITVVLAATIYVWVTGFKSGEQSENAAVTVKGEDDAIRCILTKGGDNYDPTNGYADENFAIYVNGVAVNGTEPSNWLVGQNIVLYYDTDVTSGWNIGSDSGTDQSITTPTEYAVTVEIMGTVVYDGTVIVS